MAQRPKIRTGSKTAGGKAGANAGQTGAGQAGAGNAGQTGSSGSRASRARATPGTAGATNGDTGDVRSRLHAALLAQLPTTGWRDLSYAQIVEAAGVSLAAAYQVYRSKLGVLGGFVREIDQQMLSTLEADPLDGTARDKLFDLIMRRLDLQQDNKAALDALLHDLSRSPADALCVADRLTRSMALMLEMAGIPTDSLRGFLRTQALVGLYLHVMRTWVKDESDDAAKTMALLDKRLDQAERLLGLLRPRRTAAAA